MRLDVYLYTNAFTQSRQKAQELIASKCVYVNGKQCSKSSYEVLEGDCVEVRSESKQWVSRAGEKLWGFLSQNPVMIEGRKILDIGSSTGGFSEVLLSLGAREIVCVDVGDNQLHPKLRDHPKITFFENTDIREFESEGFELIVCDVSFISLRLIIQKIYELSLGEVILLFKPQFEVGKNVKRNKKGVILDEREVQRALDEFVELLKNMGFRVREVAKSVLKGKNGNEEFFIHIQK